MFLNKPKRKSLGKVTQPCNNFLSQNYFFHVVIAQNSVRKFNCWTFQSVLSFDETWMNFVVMPKHIRFCFKSLVFETRSCTQSGSWCKVKQLNCAMLCCLFAVVLHFKILSLIWFKKALIQKSFIFLLMKYIIY